MVEKVNKALSVRPLAEDLEEVTEFINTELNPIVNRTRLSLNALLERVLEGEGSPEGVVVADTAALYLRQDGAPGSLLYGKTTDGVATGWVVVF